MTLDNSWTAGGRVGYILTNDNLVYGLIGFTQAQIQNLKFAFGEDHFTIGTPTFDGVTTGLGFEKRVTDHLSFRGEYRYTRLDDERAHGNVDGNQVAVEIDPSIHSALITAAYRFP